MPLIVRKIIRLVIIGHADFMQRDSRGFVCTSINRSGQTL